MVFVTLLPDTALLEARGLTIAAPGDASTRLAADVSFVLGAGEVVDVGGPSGSGKTAFLRALARLMPGAAGVLRLEGRPAEEIDAAHWRCSVAMLPQKPAIVDGTVGENLLLPWTLKVRHAQAVPSASDLAAALDSVGLGEIAADRDAARLSVGQQSRVALLRVLLTEPRVLLLDEVDAALDDVSADAVRTRLRSFASDGGGIVRVRHRADDGLAQRRLRLSSGNLEEVE